MSTPRLQVRTFTIGKPSVEISKARDVDSSTLVQDGILYWNNSQQKFVLIPENTLTEDLDIVSSDRGITADLPLRVSATTLAEDINFTIDVATSSSAGIVPGLGGIDALNAATVGQVNAAYSDAATHIHSTDNPHGVTKSQVGLSNVQNIDTTTTANINSSTNRRFVTDAQLVVLNQTSGINTGDETKGSIESKVGIATNANSGILSSANWTSFNTASNLIATHSARTDNPHEVTKAQVGLGNVQNVDTTTTANVSDSVNKRYVTDSQLSVLSAQSGVNTGDETKGSIALKSGVASASNSGLLSSSDWVRFDSQDAHGNRTDNPHGVTKAQVGLGNVQNVDTTTTVNISPSEDKNFVTDSEKISIGNVSGVNTGDEDKTSISVKLGVASSTNGGYLTSFDWLRFDGGVNAADQHALRRDNPHEVTKEQIGLGNVQNSDTTTTANIVDSADKRFVTDAEKIVISNQSGINTGDETQASIISKVGYASPSSDGIISASDYNLFFDSVPVIHANRTDNPHNVTKTQVGLGNVDNTSDADKPVSTLQSTEIDDRITDHNVLYDAHSATSLPTPDRIALRDSEGAAEFNAVDFETIPGNSTPFKKGRLKWTNTIDEDNHPKGLLLDLDAGITINIGQQKVVRVYNKTGSAIEYGRVVSKVSSAGINFFIDIKLPSTVEDAENILGVVVTPVSIPNNSFGYVCVYGEVHDMPEASGGGSPLFPLPGAIGYLAFGFGGGYVTGIRPGNNSLIVQIGYAIASTGRSLFVDPKFLGGYSGNAVFNSISHDATRALLGVAALNSPQFTGIPEAPDPASLDQSNQIANTRFVWDAINSYKIISKTYLELSALKASSSLVPGQLYRISDFVTEYISNDNEWISPNNSANVSNNTGTAFTVASIAATPEPLIIQAISTSAFGIQAASEQYPDDVIHYVFDYTYLDGVNTAKGFITYRKDCIKNVETNFDWRNIRFKRWLIDFSAETFPTSTSLGYDVAGTTTVNRGVFKVTAGFATELYIPCGNFTTVGGDAGSSTSVGFTRINRFSSSLLFHSLPSVFSAYNNTLGPALYVPIFANTSNGFESSIRNVSVISNPSSGITSGRYSTYIPNMVIKIGGIGSIADISIKGVCDNNTIHLGNDSNSSNRISVNGTFTNNHLQVVNGSFSDFHINGTFAGNYISTDSSITNIFVDGSMTNNILYRFHNCNIVKATNNWGSLYDIIVTKEISDNTGVIALSTIQTCLNNIFVSPTLAIEGTGGFNIKYLKDSILGSPGNTGFIRGSVPSFLSIGDKVSNITWTPVGDTSSVKTLSITIEDGVSNVDISSIPFDKAASNKVTLCQGFDGGTFLKYVDSTGTLVTEEVL